MSRLVITDALEDVEKWKPFEDERAGLLGKFATDIGTHADIDAGNMVGLTMLVQDAEGRDAMLKSSVDSDLHRRHGGTAALRVFKPIA